MDAIAVLRDHYDLGPILDIRDMSKNAGCHLIVTVQGHYVLKHIGRPDFVAVYDKVQRVLNANGLTQAGIVPARDGQLMSPDGHALLGYIAGNAPEAYSNDQFRSILSYLRRYNEVLRAVPFAPDELKTVNIWDRVKSTAFLRDNIETIADRCGLTGRHLSLLRTAGRVLSDNIDRLNKAPKQLIHADLGPGNVIFADGAVRAFIDFTPDYEHELYSLAHFLYWTCLWRAPEPPPISDLAAALNAYLGPAGDQPGCDMQLLFAYLVKACLFRLMGPALNMLEDHTFAVSKIERRLAALAALCESFGVNL